MMKYFSRPTAVIAYVFLVSFIVLTVCSAPQNNGNRPGVNWSLSALPSSLRLDPSSGRIIDDASAIYGMDPLGDLLEKNWVYDGEKVSLHAARGEYVSFQMVIENHDDTPLEDIIIEMLPFSNGEQKFDPELFLEWSVEVKEHSTGYEKGTLGIGWYPDALIPLQFIQQNLSEAISRFTYPLELPDFYNRVNDQRYLLIWVDQYVPFDATDAPAGSYSSEVTVTIDGESGKIPVQLEVWNFAIPQENKLAGNLQHEGFLRRMDERLELAVYQLFKRHRVVPVDPTYDPPVSVSDDGKVTIDWTAHDRRLEKYFTGEAFTERYGYSPGPGYGEPIEFYALPFDVYGKHGGAGWPDIVSDDLPRVDNPMDNYDRAAKLERQPQRLNIYIDAVRQVREHILSMADPAKTRLIVYLNGLDESYFPEAWDRMDFWGRVFDENFPETHFRVDGSYSPGAMEVIKNAIDYWCCHTVGYNIDTIEEYRKLGIHDWLYGPMLYETEKNSWCGSSTFMDLPLVNDRAISWSVWKYRTLTFCSWGIGSGWQSAWHNSETFKDIFRNHDQESNSLRRFNGNAMMVYAPGVIPRVNQPCASIRLKAMRDGVEEYEYFRLLREIDGTSERADGIVNSIINEPFGDKAIGNFDIWEYNPEKWDAAIIEAGKMINAALSP